METTDIYIARHGETEHNRLGRLQGRGVDMPLNERGRLQARAIADTLRDEGIARIFSSSLMRSVETAEIIAWSLRLKYHAYPELDEMDFGAREGKQMDAIQAEMDELYAAWRAGRLDRAAENGESPLAVSERVAGRMDTILQEHQGSGILLILHGRLIRILLSEWLGYGLSEMHRITHSNGALYHLRKRGDQIQAVYLNRTDHLNEIETGTI